MKDKLSKLPINDQEKFNAAMARQKVIGAIMPNPDELSDAVSRTIINEINSLPKEDVVSLSDKAKTYDPKAEAQRSADFAKIEAENAKLKKLQEEAAWASKEEPPTPGQGSRNVGELFGAKDGIVEMNMGIPITREHFKKIGRAHV